MANRDVNLSGAIKIRSAEENDASSLQMFCFPEQSESQVAQELKADLEAGSGTHRLVAESSGYAIGQVAIKRKAADSEVAQVGNLAVAGPFRQLGVADHLMEEAAAAATSDGVKVLEVELAPTETNVIQRYQNWGFSEKPVVVLQKMLGAAASQDEEGNTIEVEAEEATEDIEDEASETSGEQGSLPGV